MAVLKKNKNRIIDPVCGMTISRKDSAIRSSYLGMDYYFCSERCKSIFEEDADAVFAMKAAREEVSEEERTESLDQMADELAHEIRNPLTSIGGFARRVHGVLPENDPGRKYLEIVIENVARLENMITKLVELKTLGAFHAEPSDFNRIITETVDSFGKEFAEKGVNVELDLTDSPLIPLDTDKIKAAFAALIKNAVEAMEKPFKLLKIATSIRDEYIEAEVSDTGKGIPKDRIKYIFDPFFTSKMYGPGLGLKFTQRVIQLHRGTISVKSEPGKGAVFAVRLPLKGL
ncbi:MAG: ATP-binding protein [Nitrospiraceae bacterium]|nr:ATP-binding protein [Nitrospiraceae bacterium]